MFLNRRGAHLTRTMILIMKIYTHIDTSTLRQEILEHHPRNNQLQNRLSKNFLRKLEKVPLFYLTYCFTVGCSGAPYFQSFTFLGIFGQNLGKCLY